MDFNGWETDKKDLAYEPQVKPIKAISKVSCDRDFLHAGTRRFLRWLISTHLAHLGTDVAANWWVSPCDWFFFETIQLDYHALSRQCLEKTKVPTCSNTRITISQIKCWRYYSLQSFYHQVTPFLVSVVSGHWQCWKSIRGLTDNIW